MFDIDIDISSTVPKEGYGTRAMMYDEEAGRITPHPSGIYYNTNMIVDPETGLATIDYKKAAGYGFVKIDLLSNTRMARFPNKDAYVKATEKEPDWYLLWTDPDFVKTLPQIANHFQLLQTIKPQSVIELADFISLIRPAKVHLIEKYLADKEGTRKELYEKPDDGGYYYKKAHAVAYALQIVAVMNSDEIKPIEQFVKLRD